MRERSQGRRKPRGGDFRSVAEKILPRTLDVVTRITLYGKAAALWVVASACFLAKERFRDKPSGKPLFLKGLLRTGGSCTQRGGQSPICTNLVRMLAFVTCPFFVFQQKNPQNTQERHPQKEG